MKTAFRVQNTDYIYFYTEIDRPFIQLQQCKIIIRSYLHSMELGNRSK